MALSTILGCVWVVSNYLFCNFNPLTETLSPSLTSITTEYIELEGDVDFLGQNFDFDAKTWQSLGKVFTKHGRYTCYDDEGVCILMNSPASLDLPTPRTEDVVSTTSIEQLTITKIITEKSLIIRSLQPSPQPEFITFSRKVYSSKTFRSLSANYEILTSINPTKSKLMSSGVGEVLSSFHTDISYGSSTFTTTLPDELISQSRQIPVPSPSNTTGTKILSAIQGLYSQVAYSNEIEEIAASTTGGFIAVTLIWAAVKFMRSRNRCSRLCHCCCRLFIHDYQRLPTTPEHIEIHRIPLETSVDVDELVAAQDLSDSENSAAAQSPANSTNDSTFGEFLEKAETRIKEIFSKKRKQKPVNPKLRLSESFFNDSDAENPEVTEL